jgi:hypothetical protein
MVDLLLKTVREQRCEWLDQIEQTRQIVAAATSPANAAPGAP